ncbi:hypothetical protein NP493_13g10000 [Ridgeia piscesae]|uniref:Uncharacterized protein n=1 Tax=Ridgeia piscesae TaxID=27915 RepID=A0AAD9PER5_RIDPI|nr:hypothetical protein NP493_13g10000 [Ridgeia piscesae]
MRHTCFLTASPMSCLFSSEPSPQLSTLSHRRHLEMHLKLSQRKWVDSGQEISSQILGSSSELSPQSLSPSQRHSREIQICGTQTA